MYHSVTFGDKNTWDDWHLIPSSRPLFNPPKLKTKYIEIPGSNVVIDLTDSITGFPTYQYREGSLEFYVANGYGEWYDRYSEIMNYLHGKKMQAWLEDDPIFMYEGRFTVNSWKSEKVASKITIDYYVAPYKLERGGDSGEPFIWDPFSFETGIIRDYGNQVVEGSLTMEIVGSQMPVVPTVVTSAAVTFKIDGKTYELEAGTTKLYGCTLTNKTYTVEITGNATISIIYTGGSL